MKSSGPNYSTPALDKGLDILEYLAAAGEPKSQVEIAHALGRTVNEIFRMLNTLEARRYLLRDERSGEYTLSLRLFELGHTHSPIARLIEAAREPMRDLASSLGFSCHLAVLDEHHLVVLAHEESAQPITIAVRVGARQKAVRTTSGRLLLSMIRDEELASFLREDQEFAQFTPEQQAAFTKSVAAARSDGYLIDESYSYRGVVDIAMLVGSEASKTYLALTIPLLEPANGRLDRDLIRDQLQLRATEIKRKVGLLD